MSQVFLVVDRIEDWAPYYPSEWVLSFDQYLTFPTDQKRRVRIINLCSNFEYLSDGYYCSLLAEARGHHVLPSMRVLNDLSSPLLYQLQLDEVAPVLRKAARKSDTSEEVVIKSYFGHVAEPALKPLARSLFERFSCPILEIRFAHNKEWEISSLSLLDHHALTDAEQTEFANALEQFSKQVWRPHKTRKGARFDLAILHNPAETMPPSDTKALKNFIAAGKVLGVDVELITPDDYLRIAEFDGLFIRETTAIDHHTYRFAKKAEAEGLVVMDDPTSILRCTNKIYLADLFATHNVPTPKSLLLKRSEPQQFEAIAKSLGLPLVVKIPDGSFSRGMKKVSSVEELSAAAESLFAKSSLLLVQEFLYTDYDWRIGILNQRPIYACRYYMVKNHWQIYRHSEGKKPTSGGFDTLPTFEVPRAVLQAALKATKHIGNGIYGVDVKESHGKGYVIEVNDNPSIESGVEDLYLGKELYMLIMQEFVRRMDKRVDA